MRDTPHRVRADVQPTLARISRSPRTPAPSHPRLPGFGRANSTARDSRARSPRASSSPGGNPRDGEALGARRRRRSSQPAGRAARPAKLPCARRRGKLLAKACTACEERDENNLARDVTRVICCSRSCAALQHARCRRLS